MFENIANFFRRLMKSEKKQPHSKETAKERLHLVLMQDRANVSADFLELMKQEIIEVIKKYIEVDESAIDVRLTNEIGEDGTKGAPSLYANIPIVNIKNDIKASVKEKNEDVNNKEKQENKDEETETKKPEENVTEENKEEKTEKEDKKEDTDKKENNEENQEINKEDKEEEKEKKEETENKKSEEIKTEEASN